MKPTWTHTHNGEQGEELCCCEGKYYTEFAWAHFGAAYTGRVRPAHRDRPPAFAVDPVGEITWVNYPPQYGVINLPPASTDNNDILVGNLFPDDEITLELP